MADDRAKLEEVLRARAAEVPFLQVAPRQLHRRARRRIARNALSSVLVVGCIVGGALVGLVNLRALGGPGPHEVISGGPPTHEASAQPCTAAELRATATLDGAAGSVAGAIHVTNLSDSTCWLRGRPDLTILDPGGDAVAVRVVDVEPGWRADAKPAPQGWPVVDLRPGSAAEVRVRWSNACPQFTGPPGWTVGLHGDAGTLVVTSGDGAPVPPCNGSTEPSTLEIGPFEPAGGSAHGSG
ncbi:MAG: DUF4232 domain-containing protein [Actinomycetota bacterium]